MIISIRISEPILVPIASSIYRDDHGISKKEMIFNHKICGFEIEANVLGSVYVANKPFKNIPDESDISSIIDEYEVIDMFKDAPAGHTIYADEQPLSAELWIKMILSINENKKIIETHLQNAFERKCLETEKNIIITDYTHDSPVIETFNYTEYN
jgi:hypothetical protein